MWFHVPHHVKRRSRGSSTRSCFPKCSNCNLSRGFSVEGHGTGGSILFRVPYPVGHVRRRPSTTDRAPTPAEHNGLPATNAPYRAARRGQATSSASNVARSSRLFVPNLNTVLFCLPAIVTIHLEINRQ
jgi:hypothetical protein